MKFQYLQSILIIAVFFSHGAFAEYSANWSLSLGCPTQDNTSKSGGLNVTEGVFSGSGSCSRLSNQLAKFNFTFSDGASLRASSIYGLQTGRLSVMPPLRTSDSTPLFAVETSCPTSTTDVNWIFIQAPKSRTSDYFWGRSTMTPTSTTMTRFFDVSGVEGFNGSYSLPVNPCSGGVLDVVGSQDFQAKMYSADTWSGFYKTNPGNVSFFAPIWNIQSGYLGSKTFSGVSYNSQDSDSSKNIQVTSNAAGTVFTVRPYSDPETATLASGSGSYTDTITITAVNSPLTGMMKGTLSRVDHLSSPTGSTVNVGCLASDEGSGGYVIACFGTDPVNSSYSYSLVANYKVASGTPDPTFGPLVDDQQPDGERTGKVLTELVFTHDWGFAVALQADGKILSGGGVDNASYYTDYALVRYNPDGSLDTSFSGDGIVITPPPTLNYALTTGVAVASDGKIVTSGSAEFHVARYTSNGSLDTSFSGDGIAIGQFADDSSARSLAIQSDGKLVLGGWAGNSVVSVFAAVRFNSDGSLDTSFSGDGKQITEIGSSSTPSEAKAIALQSDGKILLAGTVYDGAYAHSHFGVVRYNSNGTLDTSFSGDGIVETVINVTEQSDFAECIAVQGDGKILVAGVTYDAGAADLAVVRYNTDGTLDTSFSGDGIMTAALGVTGGNPGNAIAIQSDGKILVGGRGSTSGFGLVRLNTDGSLDTSFSGDGIMAETIGSNSDGATGIAIQRDGKILLTGGANGLVWNVDFALMRVIP